MAMSFGSYSSRVVATRVVALDGTGDFTDIQSAINDLPSGGGVVYVKEGTYEVSSGIIINKENVSLIGSGKSTIIKNTAEGSGIYVRASGCFISQLNIDGNNNMGIIGIDIGLRCTEVKILSCWIHNFSSYGIGTYRNAGVLIEGNFIYSNGVGINFCGTNSSTVVGNWIYDNGAGITMADAWF